MGAERDNKLIGDRLERTRLALGYADQTSFAAAIAPLLPSGMSFQRWNAYERGRERITVDVALALCAEFDLTLDWIYRGRRGGLTQDFLSALAKVKD